MGKDRRFQVRINGSLLDEFDRLVGEGNRSKEINKLIEKKVEILQKKESVQWHNKQQ